MGLNTAWIALGGNLGEVQASFVCARKKLTEANNLLRHCSKIYQTPAVGPKGQPDYLNAVIEIKTALLPEELLQTLHEIENQHGRIRKEHWGARTLDLDLLAYDNLIMDTPTLTLPHPHIYERIFVLRPLCDIDANWQHPRLKQSAQVLLNNLLDQGKADLPKGASW